MKACMRGAHGWLIACTIFLALGANAAAQPTGVAPAASPAPPAPAAATPAPATPALDNAVPSTAPATDAASQACLPACRSGFTCIHAACVSACNPACPDGQTCSASGECIAPVAAPPAWTAPRFFAPPPQATQSPSPRDPSAERHDGVLLRGTLGFGGLSDQFDNHDAAPNSVFAADAHTRLSGAAEALSLDIGGAVAENTIVHARLSSIFTRDPQSHIDGTSYDQSRHEYAGAFMIGPAVTYYFMPANVYLTGALGLSWIAQRYRDSSGNRHALISSTGPGVNVDVGKEWWAADQIGVGLAARFVYSRVSDETSFGRLEYSLLGGALLLSVTYQ
jgi:hypothetical protein